MFAAAAAAVVAEAAAVLGGPWGGFPRNLLPVGGAEGAGNTGKVRR